MNTQQKKKIRKKIKRKKKVKFNIFKFLRTIIIIVVIIFFAHWILTPSTKLAPPTATPVVTKEVTPPAPTPFEQYKSKQHDTMNNIFRFNENLYMAMATNNVVNLYPDSQNGVNELSSELSTCASKLDSQTISADSSFISELMIKNNAFVNSVIAYNNETLSKTPNQATLSGLNQTVQNNYKAVNLFMNQNMNLFK